MTYPPQQPHPYGQPGYQHAGYGQPQPYAPQPGYGPYQQPQQKKGGGGKIALIVVLAAVFLLAIAGGGVYFMFGSSSLAEGDCAGAKSAQREEHIYKTSCANADASYKVVKVLDREVSDEEAQKLMASGQWQCPGDGYSAQDGVTYCVSYQAKEGECFTPYDENSLVIKTDCGAPGEKDRVTKVIPLTVTDNNGEKFCGKDSGWYVSEQPAQTICFHRQ